MNRFNPWRTIPNVLKTNQLHLGCGSVAPDGWLNCDGSWHVWLARHPWLRKTLLYLGWLTREHNQPWPDTILWIDLRQPLPFSALAFSAVYSAHLLEHLYRDEALALLREIHRCCQPGGVVRIAVPNLAKYLADYQQGISSPRAPAATPADTLMASLLLRPARAPTSNSRLRALYHLLFDFNSHKWLYDQHSLIHLFQEAGFTHPTPKRILESQIPEIHHIERPERLGGDATLIIEAIKE